MSRESVATRIRRYNEGRDPERLRRKYALMRQSAFPFYRGTCHLFADDWPADGELSAAPAAWCCGDLHFENFGAYKGDNRLEYYDVNDFDEAVLAPCTIDVARYLTSLVIGADSIAVARRDAIALGRRFLDAYAAALHDGKARWVERETAVGMVRDLLLHLRLRRRRDLLKRRTLRRARRRVLSIDGEHALRATPEARRTIVRFMRRFAAAHPEPERFRVLDVARRIAGTGSLGVARYVILVYGKGAPDKHFVIDVKAALPSVWRARLSLAQPAWRTEAQRVVAVQQRAQAIAPALFQAVRIGRTAFVLRELQPTEDRVNLALWGGKIGRLERVITTMGHVCAWMHLRSSGRQGAAPADAFIEFAVQPQWRRRVVEWADEYAEQVRHDWREFCEAMDAGAFD